MPETTRCELCILDHTGDTRLGWSPLIDDDAKAAARERFGLMRGRGYLAFKSGPDGRGELIDEFDPAAERIVMTPPAIGG